MLTAPQQDWAAYEAKARPHDAAWLRSLSPQQRFEIYAGLFNLIREMRLGQGDWSKLDAWHWQHKLAARRRVVEALRKLDQLRDE